MKCLLITGLLLACYITTPDTILTRFQCPPGYHLLAVQSGSFAAYLQSLPLKPKGTATKTYKGDIAATDAYTAAVVDISLGKQDLQQCADAVMRLRGEYLYRQKKYDAIKFHFVNGFLCDYSHYANGYRYTNNHWVLKAKKDFSYATFMRYMELVFAYAATPSLEKELITVKNVNQLKSGDVFIKGGNPGHCFIVINVVENDKHQRQFLLAQSFMPAQDIQILQYGGSPWFSLDHHSDIWYGELIDLAYLRRFAD